MIKITKGNLLKAQTEALVNTVNTVGVMGKGVALQFRRAYPEMYRAYQKACQAKDVQLGQVQVFDLGVRQRRITQRAEIALFLSL